MVAPVTGPFTIKKADGSLFKDIIVTYRQKRPYNLSLLHEHLVAEWDARSNLHDIDWLIFLLKDDNGHDAGKSAYNKAYAKFLAKLGDTTSLGIDIAQYRQADGMITKRVKQLTAFLYALKTRSPSGVASSLGISLRDVKRVLDVKYGVARTLADLWLEFHFGWEPLVKDIYGACEVFQEPLPVVHAKGRGGGTDTLVYNTGLPASEINTRTYTTFCSVGADVAVTNPNLRLMQQLGLLNPALIAWDAIPWSFVVGWFVNVDAYLSSLTDFAGLTLSRGYVKRTTHLAYSARYLPCQGSLPGCDQAYYLSLRADGSGWYKFRTPVDSFKMPYFGLKISALKPIRALTAISLLVQKLPSADKPRPGRARRPPFVEAPWAWYNLPEPKRGQR